LEHDYWAEGWRQGIDAALDAWRTGEVEQLSGLIADDVELTSLDVDGQFTLRGKPAFLDFFVKRGREFPDLQLEDVLLGVGSIALLLRNGVRYSVWELKSEDGRRISSVRAWLSVGRDFGKPVETP